jgi:hypothetical protein
MIQYIHINNLKQINMKAKVIHMFFGAVILLAALSGAVMLLWNWLIPEIFGLTAINFWQASGLLVLGRILFGGFGHGGMMHHHRNPMHEKWMKMTPEQQKEFINKRRQFGFGHYFCKNCFEKETDNKQGNEND